SRTTDLRQEVATMKNWNVVSKDKPCPICGNHRRCKLAPDSRAVVCFEPPAEPPTGWRVLRRHSSGAVTYVLDDGKPLTRRKSQPAAKKEAVQSHPTTLTPQQLDCAYSKLLEKTELLTLHHSNLLRRGLSTEQI